MSVLKSDTYLPKQEETNYEIILYKHCSLTMLFFDLHNIKISDCPFFEWLFLFRHQWKIPLRSMKESCGFM